MGMVGTGSESCFTRGGTATDDKGAAIPTTSVPPDWSDEACASVVAAIKLRSDAGALAPSIAVAERTASINSRVAAERGVSTAEAGWPASDAGGGGCEEGVASWSPNLGRDNNLVAFTTNRRGPVAGEAGTVLVVGAVVVTVAVAVAVTPAATVACAGVPLVALVATTVGAEVVADTAAVVTPASPRGSEEGPRTAPVLL